VIEAPKILGATRNTFQSTESFSERCPPFCTVLGDVVGFDKVSTRDPNAADAPLDTWSARLFGDLFQPSIAATPPRNPDEGMIVWFWAARAVVDTFCNNDP